MVKNKLGQILLQHILANAVVQLKHSILRLGLGLDNLGPEAWFQILDVEMGCRLESQDEIVLSSSHHLNQCVLRHLPFQIVRRGWDGSMFHSMKKPRWLYTIGFKTLA